MTGWALRGWSDRSRLGPMSSSAARPVPASDGVRARLSRQQRRDTRPELALRRLLHSRGLRYRVDRPPLPGMRRRADLVFSGTRVAVFVDGCFWHRCPVHGTSPKNNADWWRDKLDRNVLRDRETDAALEAAGWTVLRFWEHDSADEAAGRVAQEVRSRSARRGQ